MEQPRPGQDHHAFKAWLHRVTSAALAEARANAAYRERPGRDLTTVRLAPRLVVRE